MRRVNHATRHSCPLIDLDPFLHSFFSVSLYSPCDSVGGNLPRHCDAAAFVSFVLRISFCLAFSFHRERREGGKPHKALSVYPSLLCHVEMRAIKLGWMDRRARWYFNSVLEGGSSGRLTFVTWRMNLSLRVGLDFTAGKYLTASRNFCTALSIVCTTARCKKPASASGPSLKAFFPSSSLSAVATTHKTLTSSLRIVRVENLKGRHLEMVLKVCQRLS